VIVDLSFDRSKFSGHAPIFPLPSIVLLPGALLPLHIFEPRYRAMVKDALEGEKLIAMALLKSGWQPDYEGAPAVETEVGLGRIVAHALLEDGRSNMVLAGLRRATIVREDLSRPYRMAELEVHEDDLSRKATDEEAALRETTLARLREVPHELARDHVRLKVVQQIDVPLGVVLDLAADALELGVRDKQALLAEPRVVPRAKLLLDTIDRRLDERRRVRGGRPWPPEPGRN
jgi:Lon protease-like protein